MFCQTCGAENANRARFCNMCGIPIAEPGSPGGPLSGAKKQDAAGQATAEQNDAPSEDAGDTIAMPMTPAKAHVVATMSQQAVSQSAASASAAPSSHQEASTSSRPNPKNLELGKTTHGVGLGAEPLPVTEQPPAPSASEPAPETASASSLASPVGRKEETWERRVASADSPFGTSTSVSLKSLGLPSARTRMLFLLAGGLVLMGAGALFMYLAMKPDDTASAPKTLNKPEGAETRPEMVLGMPVPPVDPNSPTAASNDGTRNQSRGADRRSNLVSSSANTKTSTAKRGTGRSSASTASSGARKTSSGGGTRASRPASGTDGENQARSNRVKRGSAGKDDSKEDRVEKADSNREPGLGSAAPDTAPDERNLELEMYSSRVRYAVSRYYAARAQSCFDSVTKNAPNLRGTVQVAFKISANGQASGSRVSKNSTGHAGLGKCLVSQVNSWRLPPPPEPGIELQMPFSR